MLSTEAHAWYTDWTARCGPGAPEDVNRSFHSIDYEYMVVLSVWAYGVERADSFDSDAVKAALEAADSIPTIREPRTWWGEEFSGLIRLS